jgi:hypothetical protein
LDLVDNLIDDHWRHSSALNIVNRMFDERQRRNRFNILISLQDLMIVMWNKKEKISERE